MPAWLASLEPRVIDWWLAFYEIEPEAFDFKYRQSSGGKAENMLTAGKAAKMLAKFGR